jgi:hypothetical protein
MAARSVAPYRLADPTGRADMARARPAPAASLPRWIRSPRADDWLDDGELLGVNPRRDDWLAPDDFRGRQAMALLDAMYIYGDAIDLWARHNGYRDADELGLELVCPRMPSQIPASERPTGGPPKWLREAARRSARIGLA